MTQIGGYRILRRLGAGGMGEVFLARQDTAGVNDLGTVGRAVVIKTVGEKYAQDREAVARFRDEGRLALHLRHRNICGVTNVGQDENGELFLVMDYVAGRDLRDVQRALAARDRRMTTGVALYIIKELLEALDYAHRVTDPRTGEPLGIVHRDVSPSNIMISLEGEVQLIDFGHATSTWKLERTAAGTVIGKARYMSPEQARAERDVDARADLYSAAIIATELCVGTPFRPGLVDLELLEAAQKGAPSSMLEFVDDEHLRALLERALAPDRDSRIKSAAELARACEEILVARGEIVGPSDLRALMRDLFPEEPARQREILAEVLDATRVAQLDAFLIGPSFDSLDLPNAPKGLASPRRELTQLVRVRGTVKHDPSTTAKSISGTRTRAHRHGGVAVAGAALAALLVGVVVSTAFVVWRSPLAGNDVALSSFQPPPSRPAPAADAPASAVLAPTAAFAPLESSQPTTASPPPLEQPVERVRPSVASGERDHVAQPVKHNEQSIEQPREQPGEQPDEEITEPIDSAEVVEPPASPPVPTTTGKSPRPSPPSPSPVAAAAPEPLPKNMTLTQKLDALKQCDARRPSSCAGELLARGNPNKTPDDTKKFVAEVDRCVARCRR